jgi:3-phenylpropionate/trans-cinnamate dioxygenase ferredoxin component
MTLHRVAKVADLKTGSMLKVEVAGRVICLANIENVGFRAIDDKCTHEDESLSEGCLWGQEVECPAHGSRFNLISGEVCGLPATRDTRVYEVHVEDGVVLLEL